MILGYHIDYVLKQTTTAPISNISNSVKKEVNKYLRYPELIPDLRLREEVKKCIDSDDTFSPHIEQVRQIVGLEQEYILQERLRNLNVKFLSENDLREEKTFKTPDIRLRVPIGVCGNVINWIESKAMFGDKETYDIYMNKQLRAYRNRYGPGMVIFWFGYLSELEREDGIFISEFFPDEIEVIQVKSEIESIIA